MGHKKACSEFQNARTDVKTTFKNLTVSSYPPYLFTSFIHTFRACSVILDVRIFFSSTTMSSWSSSSSSSSEVPGMWLSLRMGRIATTYDIDRQRSMHYFIATTESNWVPKQFLMIVILFLVEHKQKCKHYMQLLRVLSCVMLFRIGITLLFVCFLYILYCWLPLKAYYMERLHEQFLKQ